MNEGVVLEGSGGGLRGSFVPFSRVVVRDSASAAPGSPPDPHSDPGRRPSTSFRSPTDHHGHQEYPPQHPHPIHDPHPHATSPAAPGDHDGRRHHPRHGGEGIDDSGSLVSSQVPQSQTSTRRQPPGDRRWNVRAHRQCGVCMNITCTCPEKKSARDADPHGAPVVPRKPAIPKFTRSPSIAKTPTARPTAQGATPQSAPRRAPSAAAAASRTRGGSAHPATARQPVCPRCRLTDCVCTPSERSGSTRPPAFDPPRSDPRLRGSSPPLTARNLQHHEQGHHPGHGQGDGYSQGDGYGQMIGGPGYAPPAAPLGYDNNVGRARSDPELQHQHGYGPQQGIHHGGTTPRESRNAGIASARSPHPTQGPQGGGYGVSPRQMVAREPHHSEHPMHAAHPAAAYANHAAPSPGPGGATYLPPAGAPVSPHTPHYQVLEATPSPAPHYHDPRAQQSATLASGYGGEMYGQSHYTAAPQPAHARPAVPPLPIPAPHPPVFSASPRLDDSRRGATPVSARGLPVTANPAPVPADSAPGVQPGMVESPQELPRGRQALWADTGREIESQLHAMADLIDRDADEWASPRTGERGSPPNPGLHDPVADHSEGDRLRSLEQQRKQQEEEDRLRLLEQQRKQQEEEDRLRSLEQQRKQQEEEDRLRVQATSIPMPHSLPEMSAAAPSPASFRRRRLSASTASVSSSAPSFGEGVQGSATATGSAPASETASNDSFHIADDGETRHGAAAATHRLNEGADVHESPAHVAADSDKDTFTSTCIATSSDDDEHDISRAVDTRAPKATAASKSTAVAVPVGVEPAAGPMEHLKDTLVELKTQLAQRQAAEERQQAATRAPLPAHVVTETTTLKLRVAELEAKLRMLMQHVDDAATQLPAQVEAAVGSTGVSPSDILHSHPAPRRAAEDPHKALSPEERLLLEAAERKADAMIEAHASSRCDAHSHRDPEGDPTVLRKCIYELEAKQRALEDHLTAVVSAAARTAEGRPGHPAGQPLTQQELIDNDDIPIHPAFLPRAKSAIQRRTGEGHTGVHRKTAQAADHPPQTVTSWLVKGALSFVTMPVAACCMRRRHEDDEDSDADAPTLPQGPPPPPVEVHVTELPPDDDEADGIDETPGGGAETNEAPAVPDAVAVTVLAAEPCDGQEEVEEHPI